MIIPVRCISCGSPISSKWDIFKIKIEKGEPAGKTLDNLGIKRYCCRVLFLTHKDLLKDVAKFRL